MDYAELRALMSVKIAELDSVPNPNLELMSISDVYHGFEAILKMQARTLEPSKFVEATRKRGCSFTMGVIKETGEKTLCMYEQDVPGLRKDLGVNGRQEYLIRNKQRESVIVIPLDDVYSILSSCLKEEINMPTREELDRLIKRRGYETFIEELREEIGGTRRFRGTGEFIPHMYTRDAIDLKRHLEKRLPVKRRLEERLQEV